MPVNFTEEKKKQKKLGIIAVIIIIITIIIFRYGYFTDRGADTEVVKENRFPEYPVVNINLNVLDNSWIKNSQPFKGVPIYIGKKGRTNPFLPPFQGINSEEEVSF